MNGARPDRNIVLIVEDSEACAVTLQIALETVAGIEVRTAGSVTSALSLLENHSGAVAAVITDVQLPGMTGLDLLVRMRSDERFVKVPVLIISGDSDPGIPARALASGASAYFTKPYSPSAVRRKLEQLLL